jgi:hypothetical protein
MRNFEMVCINMKRTFKPDAVYRVPRESQRLLSELVNGYPVGCLVPG